MQKALRAFGEASAEAIRTPWSNVKHCFFVSLFDIPRGGTQGVRLPKERTLSHTAK